MLDAFDEESYCYFSIEFTALLLNIELSIGMFARETAFTTFKSSGTCLNILLTILLILCFPTPWSIELLNIRLLEIMELFSTLSLWIFIFAAFTAFK